MTATPKTHLYLLLDRSGSMEAMKDDVIGGCNRLLADQQADGDDARITLVQFDTHDPEDVVVDAKRVAKVPPLTAATYVPRGGTPLLDATGALIARARRREQQRRLLGKPAEHVVVVTITDGEENQSRRFTRADVVRLVREQEARGWTFAFLGAGLDAYGEAGAMGVDARSVQAFAPTPAGARMAFSAVSDAVVSRRQKLRTGEAYDNADLFEGVKRAEGAG